MVAQPKRLSTKHLEHPELLVLAFGKIYGKGSFGIEIISNVYNIISIIYNNIDMVSTPYFLIRVIFNRLQIYPQYNVVASLYRTKARLNGPFH